MTIAAASPGFYLAQQENILAVDGTFLFILALFILLVVLANRLVYKPVLQTLAERDRLTVGASGEAASITQDYNKRLAHYEATIRQARSESYRDLEQRRSQALGERAKILEQAKAAAAAQVNSAKSELHNQVERAKNDLGADAAKIAAQISSTVLRRPAEGGSR